MTDREGFEAFVLRAEPGLRRALLGAVGIDRLEVEPRLIEALCALPESQRIAVWLAHGCGWSHGEIAEVLDVSTSTVATHVGRGLVRLRSEMGVVHDAES